MQSASSAGGRLASHPAEVWLVIPTFDERANLETVVAASRAHLPGSHRILIVDDNSPDGTGGLADQLAGTSPRDVEVMHRVRRQGLGPAYVAGLGRAVSAGARLIAQMDADLSHDPAALPSLLEAVEAGADVVIGSRYMPGGEVRDWGALRRAVSRAGNAYARAALGVGLRDMTGGFRVFRREVLEAIDLPSIKTVGYAFQVETAYRALSQGFRVEEVPIRFSERRMGKSKMGPAIAIEAAWAVPRMRLERSAERESP